MSGLNIEGYRNYFEFDERSVKNAPRSIHKVVMKFGPLLNPNMVTYPRFVWKNLDWDVVGRTLSSFPELRRVIVGLDAREDMVDFDNIARAHMSRLHGTGVFKYALLDPNEAKPGSLRAWLRASPDSDETERTFLYPWKHSNG